VASGEGTDNEQPECTNIPELTGPTITLLRSQQTTISFMPVHTCTCTVPAPVPAPAPAPTPSCFMLGRNGCRVEMVGHTGTAG
jgi:hypothetical protein